MRVYEVFNDGIVFGILVAILYPYSKPKGHEQIDRVELREMQGVFLRQMG